VGLTRLGHNFRTKNTRRHCNGIELALRGFAQGGGKPAAQTLIDRYRSGRAVILFIFWTASLLLPAPPAAIAGIA
jgi:hypothetical protein